MFVRSLSPNATQIDTILIVKLEVNQIANLLCGNEFESWLSDYRHIRIDYRSSRGSVSMFTYIMRWKPFLPLSQTYYIVKR